MQDELNSNFERQRDELFTLESICGESEFYFDVRGPEPIGSAKINMVIPSDISVMYENAKTKEDETLNVSYLPPLNLQFSMPATYPSLHAPEFTLTSCWLPTQLTSLLCDKLDSLWNENIGEEILYTWIHFLKDEGFQILNINQLDLHILSNSIEKPSNQNCDASGEDTGTCDIEPDRNNQKNNAFTNDVRAIFEETSEPLISVLKEYNEKCLQEEFEKSSIYCDICCGNFAGSHCSRFCTNHAFCNNCLKEYITTKINEGDVTNISCPISQCDAEASIILVKSLLSAELFATYERRLLTKALDTMMDIIYCPRISCQYPVCYNPKEGSATCLYCRFSFCTSCKKLYHGVLSCEENLAAQVKDIAKYMNTTEEYWDIAEETEGQKRQKLIKENMRKKQNLFSELTIDKSTKPCPQCKVRIEKSYGCNKMICQSCGTHFCWGCGKSLSLAVRCRGGPQCVLTPFRQV